jgi:phospholipase/carboxylesterase
MTLRGPVREARSGRTSSLVVLLHGYGADGGDLIGLADALGPHLPQTRFVAPNAPARCANNPMGYQWFPIPWLDGSSEAAAAEGFARASGLLDAFLDGIEAEGMPPARTALLGFSQGTMMSLEVGLRRPAPLAGIVGFSGRLLAPGRLREEIRNRSPVLLVHGDEDQMIPIEALEETRNGLAAAGVPVRWHVSRGVGHGIAPDGLGLALAFLRGAFGEVS